MPWRKFRPEKMRWSASKIAAAVVGGISLVVIFAALFGFFVMSLWNWIVPGLFALREITYPEAFGITILARLLVGGFGGRGAGSGSRKWGKGKWSDECTEDWEYAEEWWEKEGRDSLKKFAEKKRSPSGKSGPGQKTVKPKSGKSR